MTRLRYWVTVNSRRKLEVHAHAFSKSAIEAIEAKSGTAVKL
jgi:ribosomal protein L15